MIRSSTVFAALLFCLGQAAHARPETERRPFAAASAFIEALSAWPKDINSVAAPIAAANDQGNGVVSSFSAGPDLRTWQLIWALADGPNRTDDPWIGQYEQAGSYDDTDWYGLRCSRFGHASKPFMDHARAAELALYQGDGASDSPMISAAEAFHMLVGEDMSAFFWASELSDMEVAMRCAFDMTFANMTSTDAAHDVQSGLVDLFGENAISMSEPYADVFVIDIAAKARNVGRTKIDALDIVVDHIHGATVLHMLAQTYRTKAP